MVSYDVDSRVSELHPRDRPASRQNDGKIKRRGPRRVLRALLAPSAEDEPTWNPVLSDIRKLLARRPGDYRGRELAAQSADLSSTLLAEGLRPFAPRFDEDLAGAHIRVVVDDRERAPDVELALCWQILGDDRNKGGQTVGICSKTPLCRHLGGDIEDSGPAQDKNRYCLRWGLLGERIEEPTVGLPEPGK